MLSQAATQGLHLVAPLWTALAMIAAAFRAGAAVDHHATPARVDLTTLGIRPESFPKPC